MRFLTLALAVMLTLGSQVHADDEGTPANWPAPPYWTPPAAKEARSALVAASPLPFIALPPCRIIDTRGNAPLTGGFLPSATVRSYTVTGVCGIPANAAALSLNATVVHPTGPGFLTLYPQGGSFPTVSTLNFLGNDVIVNAAVVPLSASAGISMALGVSGGDVILDTNGYYAPLTFVRSLSGASGDLTLAAGSNVTITPAGNTLTIASTASGGPPTGTAGGGLSGTYPNPTVVSTSSNTPNSIVSRDGSGSFQANNLVLGALGSVSLADGCVGQSVIHVGNLPFLTVDNCSNNTFAGREAGQPGALGGLNSAFGALALDVIDTGNYNSAFGASALRHNTSGNYNSAFGLNALLNNTTASHNTAIGPDALSAQSYANGGVPWGSYNTAVGTGSLANNSPGSISNGVRNTAVGAYALLGNTFGYSNTAAGAYAGADENLRSAYVGGAVQFQPLTTGAQNTFIGYAAGTTSSTVSNCTAVGAQSYCDADDQVRLGGPFAASIGGKVGWSALSDARAKRDIRDLDLGLDFVLRLRPVEYTLKIGNGRRDLGFLAQDVEAVLGADYNVVTVGGDPARTLSLRYTDLIAPVVKAIQEQEARYRGDVEALRTRIEELETRLAALDARRPSR